MGDIGTLVSDLGGAVSSLFTGEGAAAQAKSFQGAADLATQNAQLAAASTRIQEAQTARGIFQSLGTTEADVAGAGFTNSGSALAIMRASASQGALATSLVNIQGAINENAYAAQAGAYAGEAAAANEKSKAGTIGAIASIGGALLSGTGQLISAGKTVISGYNYVSNLFSGGTAAEMGSSAYSAGALEGVGNGAGVGTALDSEFGLGGASTDIGSGLSSQFSLSGTDSLISSGANLSTDVTLDTSEIGLDTSGDIASQAIDQTFSSGIGDILPGVGSALAAAKTVGDIASGSPSAASDILIGSTLTSTINTLESTVGDVGTSILGGVGSVVGSVFGSVICTAFHKRALITTGAWLGAQRYGATLNPTTYAGYLIWAQPIANLISRYKWFAYMMLPILAPAVKEMAQLMGYELVSCKRSYYGIISHRLLLRLSWLVGKIKGMKHEARA